MTTGFDACPMTSTLSGGPAFKTLIEAVIDPNTKGLSSSSMLLILLANIRNEKMTGTSVRVEGNRAKSSVNDCAIVVTTSLLESVWIETAAQNTKKRKL